MTHTHTCDILVVGGGVAGMSAALSATRLGMKTLLIEKDEHFGGVACKCFHRYMCGLYGEDTEKTLNGGLAQEIVEGLTRTAGTDAPVLKGKVYVLPYSNTDLIELYTSLMQAETHLEILMNTEAIDVTTTNEEITAVTIKNDMGSMTVRPRAVIDCSGAAGTIIVHSGAAYEKTSLNEMQMGGCTCVINGIDSKDEMLSIRSSLCIARSVEVGELPFIAKYTTLYFGEKHGSVCIKLNLPTEEDAVSQNKAVIALTQDIIAVLKRDVPEFTNASINTMGQALIGREGIRMKGEYRLTENDVIESRTFDDGVVKNAWPIEFWDHKKGTQYTYPHDEYYEIPKRCLKSGTIKNLFAAGMCISATSQALASTRVMGTCISLGEESARYAKKYITTHTKQ